MSQISSEFLGNMVSLVSSVGGPFSRVVQVPDNPPYLAVDNSGTFVYAMINSVPQLIEVLDSFESILYSFAVVCGVPGVLSYLEITEFGPFVYADVDGTLQPIGVYL